jgi:hypothetical protein
VRSSSRSGDKPATITGPSRATNSVTACLPLCPPMMARRNGGAGPLVFSGDARRSSLIEFRREVLQPPLRWIPATPGGALSGLSRRQVWSSLADQSSVSVTTDGGARPQHSFRCSRDPAVATSRESNIRRRGGDRLRRVVRPAPKRCRSTAAAMLVGRLVARPGRSLATAKGHG